MIDGISPEIKAKIIALCAAIIPTASVWLYGSRARGDFTERSDIDIALDTGSPLSFYLLAELREVLGTARVPYSIDIVDINGVSDEKFKQDILTNRILWKK